MAKGKHSTALFEVIHSGRGFDRRDSAGGFRTPKWWFKGRAKTPPAGQMHIVHDEPAFNGPSSGATPSQLADASEPSISGAPVDPTAGAAADRGNHQTVNQRSSETSTDSGQWNTPFNRSSIDWKLDSDRHEMTVRVRYTTAIVSAFAVLVAVGLAYVLGRHLASGPQTAQAANSVEEVLGTQITPAAMDVPAHRASDVRPTSPGSSLTSTGSRLPSHDAAPTTPHTVDPGAPVQRVIGTNYIIVHSYPSEKKAIEACDALNQGGVACTVEKSPPGWAVSSGWFSIITTAGFAHPRDDPQYDVLKQAIQRVSDKFAGKGFARFEPHPYKWK